VYPFLDRISVSILRNIRTKPDIVTDAMVFLGQNRQSFIQTTLDYTIPALVCEGDAAALHAIASVIKIKLSELLVEKATEILTHILLQRHPRANQKTVPPMQFLVNTIRETIDVNQVNSITPATLVNSCHMPLAVNLIIELGDDDRRIKQLASRALHEAQRIKDPKRPDDLGAFLKPVMLGILTHLNDTLHDMRGKKSVTEKRKLIRSLGALIKLVGDSMSSYSPQVCWARV
jgi:serine/threonine-protein kinase ATR